MKKIKVAVLMGGKTPEYDVSLSTGREVVANLDPQKFAVLPVVISRNGQQWKAFGQRQFLKEIAGKIKKEASDKVQSNTKSGLAANDSSVLLRQRRVDVVFIAMHGPYGEDGTIQGLLELAGLPYTGSGVLASALGMDKIMFRKIMEREKIPMSKSLILNDGGNQEKIWKFFKRPPLFVKPYNQGSSVGVSLVHHQSEMGKALELAFKYSQPVIVEEDLKGLEIQCGVLGNDKPYALPAIEIVPKNEFFDYEAKYQAGKSEEIVPARISADLTKEIQRLAVKVFKAIGAKGFGRVDMILTKTGPKVLEINTIPGLTSASLLPKEARAAGINYPQLLEKIIGYALEAKA